MYRRGFGALATPSGNNDSRIHYSPCLRLFDYSTIVAHP